jgi:hypothetical protein
MLKDIKRIVATPGTILFIGSGISIWSGLPTWKGLILNLIDFLDENNLDSKAIKKAFENNDLILAASLGKMNLSNEQFIDFITKSCNYPDVVPHDIYKKIIGLGITYFMSTNYDNLIELSVTKWDSSRKYSIVNNKQQLKIADIIQSQANNILFKIHGDIKEPESIILGKEDYRKFQPGGELSHVSEGIKNLMLTRPVIYLGFGLKDPDFLFLRDFIFNTFKNNNIGHYAIMPDILPDEVRYYKDSYNIKLIGYKTLKGKPNPHLSLIDLLEKITPLKNTKLRLSDSEIILSLARYCSKFIIKSSIENHIPLVAHRKDKRNNPLQYNSYPELLIDKLLEEETKKIILIGLPGSGKTYSINQSVSKFAQVFFKSSIENNVEENYLILPVFADLKLYNGDLLKLLNITLPFGITLNYLIASYKIRIYLDAFNEIPKKFIEDGSWDADFSKFNKIIKKTTLIITSRSVDGLEHLDFPVYSLESIQPAFLQILLSERKITLNSRYKQDLLSLIKKPFFFRLIYNSSIHLRSVTKPKDIYEQYLSSFLSDFFKTFSKNIDLLSILGSVAITSIDSGDEAFDNKLLTGIFESELNDLNLSQEIVNWLINKDFIIPLINERISFFHQSMTEFIAAKKIVTEYSRNKHIIVSKLINRRWDQALFFVINLLPKNKSSELLQILINKDFKFTISASKYFDFYDPNIITTFLKAIILKYPDHYQASFNFGFFISNSVFVEKHNKLLRKIVLFCNVLGGVALGSLVKSNLISKRLAFKILIKNHADYNFCSHFARDIASIIKQSDYQILISSINTLQKKLKDNNYAGFSYAIAHLLQNFQPDQVTNSLYNSTTPLRQQKIALKILGNYLHERKDSSAFEIALSLLSQKIEGIVSPLYLIVKFGKDKDSFNWNLITASNVHFLTSLFSKKTYICSTSFTLLQEICKYRPDFVHLVNKISEQKEGLAKLALTVCVKKGDANNLINKELNHLVKLNDSNLGKINFELLSTFNFNWKGHESLLVKLLKRRNIQLSRILTDTTLLFLTDTIFSYPNIRNFDIGPIKWWLIWISESYNPNDSKWYFFCDRITGFFSQTLPTTKKIEFLNEFNNPKSKYRDSALIFIYSMGDFKISQFTDESLNYLINNMKSDKSSYISRKSSVILTHIATDDFVVNNLLPELVKAKGK